MGTFPAYYLSIFVWFKDAPSWASKNVVFMGMTLTITEIKWYLVTLCMLWEYKVLG